MLFNIRYSAFDILDLKISNNELRIEIDVQLHAESGFFPKLVLERFYFRSKNVSLYIKKFSRTVFNIECSLSFHKLEFVI